MTRNLSFSRSNFRFALVIGLTLSLLFIFGLAPSETGVLSAEEPPRQEYVPDGVPIANQDNPTAQMAIDALDLVTSEVSLVNFGITDHTGLKIYGAPLSDFPTAGDSFMIMSTGCAAAADYPDDPIFPTACILDGLNTGIYFPWQVEGTDMVQMTIDLTPPPGVTSFQFDWKLFSEEFPDFVGFGYNDTFIVETPASTFAIDLDPLYFIPTVSAPNNIAFDGSGNLISINSTGVYGMSAGNAVGTTYNGATAMLTTVYPFAEGTPSLTFVFSLMDLGDDLFDTSVFLDNLRWGMESGPPMTSVLENCTNGVDDDGDGLVDGDDPDCAPPTSTDNTPPVVTFVGGSELGNNGWYVTDVNIQWDVTDPESPITSTVGCDPTTLTSDTTGITYTCTATSEGGTTSENVVIKRDATLPVIAITSPVDYAVDPVDTTIGFDTSDATSGLDTVSATLDDGTGAVPVSNGDPVLTAGIYTLAVSASDMAGNQHTVTHSFVIYDPSTGFATGGGWFIPGQGINDDATDDLLPGLDYVSKATFGFVVKYKNGASTAPSGQLQFQYHVGDFKLHSSDYKWLVLTNNNWAKFQGVATLNGSTELYPFKVDAFDADNNGIRAGVHAQARMYPFKVDAFAVHAELRQTVSS